MMPPVTIDAVHRKSSAEQHTARDENCILIDFYSMAIVVENAMSAHRPDRSGDVRVERRRAETVRWKLANQ